MRSTSFFFKQMAILWASMFLIQCTSAVQTAQYIPKKASSPYPLQVDAYLALANKHMNDEKQAFYILAASRTLYDGNPKASQEILSHTSGLSPKEEDKKHILLAKIALLQDHSQTALHELTKVKQLKQLPIDYQSLYHESLAQIYQVRSNHLEAAQERVKLANIIQDDTAIKANERAIWYNLTQLPVEERRTFALEAKGHALLKGWVELVNIAEQPTWGNELLQEVKQWQSQHGDHPANHLLPAVLPVNSYLSPPPTKLALLLPLSGPLGGPGAAVRDGFMAALNENNSSSMRIKTYDTVNANLIELYQQALSEGANYVVGPLLKSDVIALAEINHPVPTILLNDWGPSGANNLYSLSLSPANEARQAALRARKHGLKKALLIIPNDSWGREVSASFSESWGKNGGEIADTLVYDKETNLNESMRVFLQVSKKDAYEKPILKKNTPQEPLIETPKRRQDFDMIFLLAYPSKAREIMPLIKYFFAGDVPVYATSSSYSGSPNRLRDKDLDGITFCDNPWVVDHTMMAKNWPEQFNSYSRLYALGMESFKLTQRINQLALLPNIYYSEEGRLDLPLAWNTFKNGLATKMLT